jgi:putative alpha-1,2-mannosidase
MPQLANNVNYSADSTPDGRKVPFSHNNEIALPNYYGVTLNNNIKVEIAPHDHSTIFRFIFPTDQHYGALIFDSVRPKINSNAELIEKFKFDANTISGYVLNAEGANRGTTVMYIYGEFSNNYFTVNNTNENNKQNLTFDLNYSNIIDFKFATSFISQAQAQHNLQMEITQPNHTFDTLVNYASNV